MSAVKMICAVVAGALVGALVSYYAGVLLACMVIWPGANLCGLPIALFVAPLGLIAGAVVGFLLARRLRWSGAR